MDTQQIRNDIKTKIQEINAKILELKEKAVANMDKNEDYNKTVRHLEGLRDMIKQKYAEITSTDDSDSKRQAELINNVYNSIDTFDMAFTKAGSIFKTK